MRKINITIPEPCHEDWAAMIPKEKGWHCANCNKEVIDFTNHSDDELDNELEMAYHQRKDICGRFDNAQLVDSNPNYLRIPYFGLTFRQQFIVAFSIVFLLGGLSSCKSVDQTTGDIVITPSLVDSTTVVTLDTAIINSKKTLPQTILTDPPIIAKYPFDFPFTTGGVPLFDYPQNWIWKCPSITFSLPKPADNLLLFETNSYSLGKKQTDALDDLAKRLKKYSSYSIELVGNTDNRGPMKTNKALSLKRAQEVKKYLSKLGVKVSICRGVGEQFPLFSNTSMVGRSKNRRVEIFVSKIKKKKGDSTNSKKKEEKKRKKK